MAERDREHAVPALERAHPGDEASRRLARGVDGRDHPAVERGHHRPHRAAGGAQREVEELLGALVGVGVRVLLVEHQEVARRQHLPGEMAVRVELGADHDGRADQGADAREQVALAVVVAVGDHRAMQRQQHDLDRECRPQLVEQPVAERLPGVARGRAGRRGEGGEALDHGEAIAGRPPARGDQRPGEEARLLGMAAGRKPEVLLETAEPGRDRREAVGLRAERRHEQPHASISLRARLL